MQTQLKTISSVANVLSPTYLENKKIMVIDDQPDTRALVERILAYAGAQVATAPSAIQALAEIAVDHVFDLILCDIAMPEMDGYQFIRILRAREVDNGRQSTPAIALTAFVSEKDRLEALEAGFDAHLPKPVERARLVSTIHDMLHNFKQAAIEQV